MNFYKMFINKFTKFSVASMLKSIIGNLFDRNVKPLIFNLYFVNECTSNSKSARRSTVSNSSAALNANGTYSTLRDTQSVISTRGRGFARDDDVRMSTIEAAINSYGRCSDSVFCELWLTIDLLPV